MHRVFLLLLISPISAFYLPGVAPITYSTGESVPVRVNTLSSIKSILGYDFYSLSLFCRPSEVVEMPENLGEVLAGERTENSVYEIIANTSQFCKVACRVQWTAEDVNKFLSLAGEGYRVNMYFRPPPLARVQWPYSSGASRTSLLRRCGAKLTARATTRRSTSWGTPSSAMSTPQ